MILLNVKCSKQLSSWTQCHWLRRSSINFVMFLELYSLKKNFWSSIWYIFKAFETYCPIAFWKMTPVYIPTSNLKDVGLSTVFQTLSFKIPKIVAFTNLDFPVVGLGTIGPLSWDPQFSGSLSCFLGAPLVSLIFPPLLLLRAPSWGHVMLDASSGPGLSISPLLFPHPLSWRSHELQPPPQLPSRHL